MEVADKDDEQRETSDKLMFSPMAAEPSRSRGTSSFASLPYDRFALFIGFSTRRLVLNGSICKQSVTMIISDVFGSPLRPVIFVTILLMSCSSQPPSPSFQPEPVVGTWTDGSLTLSATPEAMIVSWNCRNARVDGAVSRDSLGRFQATATAAVLTGTRPLPEVRANPTATIRVEGQFVSAEEIDLTLVAESGDVIMKTRLRPGSGRVGDCL